MAKRVKKYPLQSIKLVSMRSRRLSVKEAGPAYAFRANDAKSVAKLVRCVLDGADEERIYVISLDPLNRPLGIAEVGKGSPEACPVDIRTIFRTAIHLGATSIILAHNHPTDNCEPSFADRLLTKRVFEAGNVIGMQVLDHVIVGETTHCSFREEGDFPC
jgi:DNA repair protein RadC